MPSSSHHEKNKFPGAPGIHIGLDVCSSASKVGCQFQFRGHPPMRSAIFHSTFQKYCACHEKTDASSYEVLHMLGKIIFPKLKIWCSKMQSISGNQRPDFLTSLMNMSLVVRLPCDLHHSRSASNAPRLPSLLDILPRPAYHFRAPGPRSQPTRPFTSFIRSHAKRRTRLWECKSLP